MEGGLPHGAKGSCRVAHRGPRVAPAPGTSTAHAPQTSHNPPPRGEAVQEVSAQTSQNPPPRGSCAGSLATDIPESSAEGKLCRKSLPRRPRILRRGGSCAGSLATDIPESSAEGKLCRKSRYRHPRILHRGGSCAGSLATDVPESSTGSCTGSFRMHWHSRCILALCIYDFLSFFCIEQKNKLVKSSTVDF